jgi:ABC-type multidrug transport system ATPase subunit
MSLITLIDAGYRYPGADKWVFRHFDMAIESGEAIKIAGRNGSGKTTLLKVLSGLLELREGTFANEGGTNITYMDQFAGEMLARDLTIAEQLRAAAVNESSRTTSMEILDEFGLGLKDRAEEFVGHLSGGQRQIIALLSTLAAGAHILCLDEFTSSLDEHSRQVADRLLLHAKATNKIALVLVSHAPLAIGTDRDLNLEARPILADT